MTPGRRSAATRLAQGARPAVVALQYGVGLAVLALGLRTWVVLGWIEPVYVAGSSMAPAYQGEHRVAACPHCLAGVRLAADAGNLARDLQCPWCERANLAVGKAASRGDRLWIDRTAYLLREPRRWMPLAVICPDTGRLCIKRLLGKPNEAVALVDGDLWIDGRLCRKTLAEQREVRVPVHRETAATRRWSPSAGADWQWRDDRWQSQGPTSGWLVEQRRRPITDAVWFDLGRSRRLHVQRDVMFSGQIAASQGVELQIRVTGATQGVLWVKSAERATCWELDRVGQRIRKLGEGTLPTEAGSGERLYEFSTFDRQVVAAVDGQTIVRGGLPVSLADGEGPRTFAISASGGPISVRAATLWRDLYHGRPPPGTDWSAGGPRWQLGRDEYFVAGDNGAVSLDSRVWGPLPRRLVAGQPRRFGRPRIAFPPNGGRPL